MGTFNKGALNPRVLGWRHSRAGMSEFLYTFALLVWKRLLRHTEGRKLCRSSVGGRGGRDPRTPAKSLGHAEHRGWCRFYRLLTLSLPSLLVSKSEPMHHPSAPLKPLPWLHCLWDKCTSMAQHFRVMHLSNRDNEAQVRGKLGAAPNGPRGWLELVCPQLCSQTFPLLHGLVLRAQLLLPHSLRSACTAAFEVCQPQRPFISTICLESLINHVCAQRSCLFGSAFQRQLAKTPQTYQGATQSLQQRGSPLTSFAKLLSKPRPGEGRG